MKAGRQGEEGPGARPHRPAALRGRGEAGPGGAERGAGRHASARRWRWTAPSAELDRVEGLVQARAWPPAPSWSKATADYDGAAGPAGARRSSGTAPGRRRATRRPQTNLSQDDARARPSTATVIELSREVGERVRGSDFSEDVVMTIAALNSDGGEDRGRRARGGAPQARPARGDLGRRARGSDLRGLGGGDRPEGAPSRTRAPRPRSPPSR